jgi:hypothetical protein
MTDFPVLAGWLTIVYMVACLHVSACLQGDLLWSYAGLDLRAQTVIAEAIGVEPALLLQDLRSLSTAANFL